MLQPRQPPSLLQKSLDVFGSNACPPSQHFDRHRSIELRVMPQIDNAKPAAAQHAPYQVPSKCRRQRGFTAGRDVRRGNFFQVRGRFFHAVRLLRTARLVTHLSGVSIELRPRWGCWRGLIHREIHCGTEEGHSCPSCFSCNQRRAGMPLLRDATDTTARRGEFKAGSRCF